MSEIIKINEYEIKDAKAIRFTSQSLTAAQQKQARENIGVGASSFSEVAISIAVSKWVNKAVTLKSSDNSAIGNVTTGSHIELFSSEASAAAFVNGNIRLTAQAAGSVTISCDTVPTAAISANLLILN